MSGINVSVLLKADYDTGTRVWTFTMVDTATGEHVENFELQQPYDLNTALWIATEFMAGKYLVAVTWTSAPGGGYTLATAEPIISEVAR